MCVFQQVRHQNDIYDVNTFVKPSAYDTRYFILSFEYRSHVIRCNGILIVSTTTKCASLYWVRFFLSTCPHIKWMYVWALRWYVCYAANVSDGIISNTNSIYLVNITISTYPLAILLIPIFNLKSRYYFHYWNLVIWTKPSVYAHCCLVTPYGDRDLGQHWLRLWLVTWRHQAIAWTRDD